MPEAGPGVRCRRRCDLDGPMCLVEPDMANRRRGIRRVSADSGSRDMPIGVKEYEVRATIDATVALNVGNDGRAPATTAPRPKASGEHQSRS
jgi:hypothetical protein